jgi:hypothetical protein
VCGVILSSLEWTPGLNPSGYGLLQVWPKFRGSGIKFLREFVVLD